jgi:hypothetical protein
MHKAISRLYFNLADFETKYWLGYKKSQVQSELFPYASQSNMIYPLLKHWHPFCCIFIAFFQTLTTFPDLNLTNLRSFIVPHDIRGKTATTSPNTSQHEFHPGATPKTKSFPWETRIGFDILIKSRWTLTNPFFCPTFSSWDTVWHFKPEKLVIFWYIWIYTLYFYS